MIKNFFSVVFYYYCYYYLIYGLIKTMLQNGRHKKSLYCIIFN